MTKNLRFVKGVVDSDDLFPLNVNMETLKDSKIIKVISKNLVMKAIKILRKLAEKDESNKEKGDNTDGNTKEVEINKNREVAETDNDKLVVDATNDAHPPQDVMNTPTAADAKEGRDNNNVGAEEGNNNN